MPTTKAKVQSRSARNAKKGKSNLQEAKKTYIQSLRGQQPATGETLHVKHIVWGNFLHNDETRVLMGAVCFKIDWSTLAPDEWVLFLNLQLNRAALTRLTPGGNVIAIRCYVSGDPQVSLVDIADAIGEKDLIINLDGKNRRIVKGKTKTIIRRGDLVELLEVSREKAAGWVESSSVISKVLGAQRRLKLVKGKKV